MYFALPYWRYGKLPESSHESLRGRLAGLPPVHDDLPPAPPVLQEAEQSKHITTEVCTHGRRVKFADDSSAQLPSPPSARPALAMEGCGDGPATMTSFDLRDLRRMLLALHRGCGVAPPDPDGYAGAVVYLLRLAREWRIAGYASGADKATSVIEDIIVHFNLLADSDRTEFLQRLRAFQSSASLPLCPTCEAELAKGKTYQDLGRLIHRDCPCRPSPVSPASEAAPAACAPADRDACCPGISGGVLPRADVASVDDLDDHETRSEHFATDVAEHSCVALPDGPDDLSAAESADDDWGDFVAYESPRATAEGGDARVNELLDPLQGSLAIGEATPVIFRGDLQALAPKEAISAFDTSAVQLALLAAPDAPPIRVSDQGMPAVGPTCSAEIDQTLVS